MTETEAPYDSATGLRILRRLFVPESRPPRGILVIIHGLGEHTGRYAEIVEPIVESCGLIAAGVDLPGHGDSPGRRGHIASLDLVHELVTETRGFLLSQLPDDATDPPTALFAHSMGGLLGLDHLNRYPKHFAYAWINAPPLSPGHNRSRAILAIARYLDRLWPSFTVHNAIRSSDCFDETDPEFIRRHKRKCHQRISFRLGVLLIDAARRLTSDPDALPAGLHLLMTQGGADRVCEPGPNQAFFEILTVEDKTWKLFPGLLHECCRKPEVRGFATEWFGRQLG